MAQATAGMVASSASIKPGEPGGALHRDNIPSSRLTQARRTSAFLSSAMLRRSLSGAAQLSGSCRSQAKQDFSEDESRVANWLVAGITGAPAGTGPQEGVSLITLHWRYRPRTNHGAGATAARLPA
jgi:hypothetical protein